MRVVFKVFIVSVLFSLNSFGENIEVIDSLKFILEGQVDTMRVVTLNELAWEYRKSNPEKAKQYAILAKALSEEIKYLDGKLTSLNRLGTVAIYQKNIDKAESIFQQVLEGEISRNNKYGIGRAYNQLGIIYTEKKEYARALEFTLSAQEKFEELNKENIVAITSNNIGDLYRRLGMYELAMKYFLKSLEIKKTTKNNIAIALTYQNIGVFQMEIKNLQKALQYLNRSKQIFIDENDYYELAKTYKNIGTVYYKQSKLDSALISYKASIDLKQRFGLVNKDSGLFNNLGIIYFKKLEYKKALYNYQKSIDLENSAKVYNNIGHVYTQLKQYNKAIYSYNQALKCSEKSKERLEYLNSLNNLSNVYSKKKNYSLAYKYGNKFIELKDSLENQYKNAIHYKMEYEEEQRRIELLEKDNRIYKIAIEKKNLENQKKNILIISLCIILLILILLLFTLVSRNRQKQRVKVAEENREIEKQKVEDLLRTQELKSIDAMMRGQEEERRRIARDLHDRLGSMLAMVKNHFKSVESSINDLQLSNVKLYMKANKLLDEACDEVRKISHDIDSGTLTKFGLTTAISDLCDILVINEEMEVEFVPYGLEDRLPLNVEITIYRIIQELIGNILKHANATQITIQILKGKDILNVNIEDNGVGFIKEKVQFGMGLKNIESRVNSLEGELEIDSIVKKGTTVMIDLPLEKVYKDD